MRYISHRRKAGREDKKRGMGGFLSQGAGCQAKVQLFGLILKALILSSRHNINKEPKALTFPAKGRMFNNLKS